MKIRTVHVDVLNEYSENFGTIQKETLAIASFFFSKLQEDIVGVGVGDHTAQKMKFSIKDFFSKCDQIRSFLWIRSRLLKKSLMENLIFCAVLSEKLKTLTSSNYHRVSYILAEILHTFPTLQCLEKPVWDFFVLFRS